MEIQILAPETLQCYPHLPDRLQEWVSLTGLPHGELNVIVFCGSLLEAEINALIWHFDPRDLTKGLPKIIGKFKPPSLIHLDIALDRPRWAKLALYFFHECGHYQDYLMGKEMTEASAESYALSTLRKFARRFQNED